MPFTKKKKQWTRLLPQFCEIKFSDVFLASDITHAQSMVNIFNISAIYIIKSPTSVQSLSQLQIHIQICAHFPRAISDFVIDRKEIDSIRNVLGCYSFMTHVDSNLPSKNSSAPQKTLRNSLVSTMALFCFWFGILFLHKTLWK